MVEQVLGRAQVSHFTRRGLAALDWHWDGAAKILVMNLTVPVGSTADVHTARTIGENMLSSIMVVDAANIHTKSTILWPHNSSSGLSFFPSYVLGGIHSENQADASADIVTTVSSGSHVFHFAYT